MEYIKIFSKRFNIKLLVLLIFNTQYLILSSQTNYKTFYYENGAKSSEGTMREGKPDGYWKNYYKNGNLKIEGNRKNFVLDSVWKFYSEKGKITKAVNYLEGKKNGFTLNYDTNQKVIYKETFIKDIKQGNSYNYYPSGKLKQIIPFVKNKADGLAYEFNQDSVVISITKYQMGFIAGVEKINRTDEKGNKQGIHKDFYEDGKIKEEKKYNDNQIDGYVKSYDQKGNLKNTEKFNNGKVVKNAPELAKLDVFHEYYEDGTMKYEGGYINGKPVGIHYHYVPKQFCDSLPISRDDTSGVMIKKYVCRNQPVPDSAIVFDNGFKLEYGAVDSVRSRVGIWTEYHPTGEFKAKGKYLNDKRIGEWTFYYPNGQIEQKGRYDKKGKIQGDWKWYYESGKILREEIYSDNLRNGLMTEFTEDNKIITKGEYVDDMREGLWFYETPEYKEVGKYAADKPDSIWKRFYLPKGNLRYVGNYINGDEDGTHKWFFPDGRTMVEGDYTAGMKQKDWKFYNEYGVNYLTIFYDNDIEIKFQGVKVTPTYEESIRDYSSALQKKSVDKVISEKDKIISENADSE